MRTLKALIILALLYKSDSYSSSRRSKGGPKNYKRELECKNVMDCAQKKLCWAAPGSGAKESDCKCHNNECESEFSCETDNVCITLEWHTISYPQCYQHYFSLAKVMINDQIFRLQDCPNIDKMCTKKSPCICSAKIMWDFSKSKSFTKYITLLRICRMIGKIGGQFGTFSFHMHKYMMSNIFIRLREGVNKKRPS